MERRFRRAAPRVRDTDAEEERSLESYQTMKSAEVGPELTKAILLGLSQGDYRQVAGQFVDGFGLSQSSVSRRFQERAQQALEEFETRSLEKDNYLALWIDGKRVAGQQGDPLHGRGLKRATRRCSASRKPPQSVLSRS